MRNTGKCPKCKKTIAKVSIEDVVIYVGTQARWRGLNYLCQDCKAVLSVGIDPIALKADIVAELLAKLQKQSV